ncbi:anchored repeat-type ABC transporter ATP-binding subunit [Streptomyces sp. MS19]|uniref:anchored repeat-type ABC transporter ATP-binding subunit n=1 Tax=Streptomyces sp. MS19 TaxID=3385972 RepID=UPI00399EF48F
MTALSVSGLRVDLGGRTVLRDVSLDVAAGEFVGLAGPNGAGKTTLLRSVLGLVRRAEGRVTVEDAPVPRVRHRVGYVPQRHEFAWDFPVSVRDAVLYGRVRRVGWVRRPGLADHRAVEAALARVGMGALRRRPVGELSGGQRQRVLVARALVAEPAVLLLDEPFTGLDMPTQEQLTALFAELAGEGKAVLMTTHDLLGALHACSRLVLVNRTVVADGTPDELRHAAPWQAAFGVGPGSPLLAGLGVA